MLHAPLRRRLPASLLVLVASSAGCSPGAAHASSPAHTADASSPASAFAADVHDSGAARRIVGGAALVEHGGRVVAAGYYGLADLAAHRPVDAETLWHWGSVTKLFTTVAILQLRDRGLLNLDDPATKYLPELRAMHTPAGSVDAITIRHLLTHRSGMRASTFPWHDWSKTWQPFAPPGWGQLAAMMPYSELAFAPGTQVSYSNIGYSVLGRIVELLTNDPFVSYVDKNILRPLGMTRTYYNTTPPYLIEHRSKAYQWENGAWTLKPWDFDEGAETPNGGLNGPLDDMARFAAFLCPTSPRPPVHDIVLAASSLAEMRVESGTLPESAEAGGERVGLGAMLIDSPGGRQLFGHSGLQSAFTSQVRCDPETGWGVIAAVNSLGSEPTTPGRHFYPEVIAAAEKRFFPPIAGKPQPK
ncbi:MAG: serine hydrolase domain-containing protein [Polyangiaceae bacterium]